MRWQFGIRGFTCLLLWTVWTSVDCAVALAEAPVVPGTGELLTKVGDDFEDPTWRFVHNFPKSSREIDKQLRRPTGYSVNRRWYEGAKRGQPDIIHRVATPPGGISGSEGALLLQTRLSGVPGTRSGEMEQDDLIVNVRGRMNGFVPMSWSPSIVVRVYLPPFDQWERRTGIHFGFRGDAEAYVTEQGKGFFGRTTTELKEYWPGIFIYFTSKYDSPGRKDEASFLLRAGPRGFDFPGPKITKLGWWTLGVSFTPDGQVHYYASPGVEDLTEEDYITSQFPYGYRCDRLNNFFFNVANRDDGHTWSTPWVIDDPSLYFIRGGPPTILQDELRNWPAVREYARRMNRMKSEYISGDEPVERPRSPARQVDVPSRPSSGPGMEVSTFDDGPRFAR